MSLDIDYLVTHDEYRAAEDMARGWLARAEQESPANEASIAAALDTLVVVQWKNGKGADGESQALAARAVALRERLNGPDDIHTTVSLRNQGKLLVTAGDYKTAHDILALVLERRRRLLPADSPDVAQSLGDLGGVSFVQGEYSTALERTEQAVEIYRRVEPAGAALANQLGNLASIKARLGDLSGAEGLAREAIGIRERAEPPSAGGVAYLVLLLADIEFMKEDDQAAQALYERALTLEKDSMPPTHYLVGITLRGLGAVRLRQKDYEASRRFLERALTIHAEALGEDNPIVASDATWLAFARMGVGDAAGAGAILERTLEMQDKTIGRRHPDTAMTIANLTRLLVFGGDLHGALERAIEAGATWRRDFREVVRDLAQEDALQYETTMREDLDMAWGVLTRLEAPETTPITVARVWDDTIRSRALVLDEIARQHHARAETTHPGRARDAETGFEDMVRAMPDGSAMVAYVEYDSNDVEPFGAAAPSYLALVLTPGSREPRMIRLGPAGPIDTAVRRWRVKAGTDPRRPGPRDVTGSADVRAAEESYADAGGRLRKLVWDPLADAVVGAKILFVVPDGALQLVNLETLPGREREYLLEEAPLLHTLSSERDIVRDDAVPRGSDSLLAFGGADFNARPGRPGAADDAFDRTGAALDPANTGAPAHATLDPSCGSARPMHFGPLPASGAEARTITRIWSARGPALLLTGAAANEAAFDREAPRHEIVHIATHGFFLDRACDAAASKPPNFGARIISPALTDQVHPSALDPFLMSGLALAGANAAADRDAGSGLEPHAEDGILTAEEIAGLDLARVRWVVLSGCSTGVGDVFSGEGVLGLRRAFAIAGADTLIMSLWSVEDDAARTWMQKLYEARARGLSTAESLRRADLDVLADLRRHGRTTHPYFWGAFMATGDWR